ncbi:MAG: helix-turn-helix transcriptional regulator [Treponema sp.]|nr:helix-turn-helix transcriptional regulator [Treponema sp.]
MMKAYNDELLNRIDILTKERGISKQSLCDTLQISRSTFSNWKILNGAPNADTLLKVANYFYVSTEWLLTGKLSSSSDFMCSPSQIYLRILELLTSNGFSKMEPGFHDLIDDSMMEFFSPISGIVDIFELRNWAGNRSIPSYDVLKKLSDFFEKSIDYILTGRDNTIPENIEKVELSRDDANFVNIYKNKWEYFLREIDELPEPDQKMIRRQVSRLFQYFNHVNGRDFDFEYIRKHPDEPSRQRDLNEDIENY